MLDEDCFLESHPLQQYLSDLGLREDAIPVRPNSDVSSNSPNAHHALSDKYAALRAPLCYIFSPALCFAHCVRINILRNLFVTALHSPEDNPIFQHFEQIHQTSLDDSFKFFLLVFALHLGLLSLCFFSTSLYIWLLATFSLCFCLICISATLFMFVILWLVRYISKQTTLMETQLRSCVIFLQNFEQHNTFGNVGIPSSRSSRYLQQKFLLHLRSHVSKMLHLSLLLKKFPLSGDLCSNLSFEQVHNLRDALHQKPYEDSTLLNDCKMLREVSLLLDSDVFSQLMGIFCFLSTNDVLDWWHLVWVLGDWAHFLYCAQHSLRTVDQLHVALEKGASIGVNGAKMDTNSDCGAELHAVHRTAHNLRLHLLVALDRTRELEDALSQTGGDTLLNLSSQLSYIQLQLQACENFREELEKLLVSPSDGGQPDFNGTTLGDTDEPVTYSMLHQANPVAMEAKDLEPEDDVLEDVAVGLNESEDEDNQQPDPDLDTGLSVGPPLYASVLKELQVVIACRRLKMQEREQRALEKRLHTNPSPISETPAMQPVTSAQFTEPGNCGMRPFVAENTVDPDPITSQEDAVSDSSLNDFFRDAAVPEKADLIVAQRRLRNQCSWHTKSAVSKRFDLFRQASNVSKDTGDDLLVDGSDALISPNDSLPPRARYPTNPFVSNPSFAAALLARRRNAGYKEEEAFVDIGTGDGILGMESEQ
ncbi:hypothetical protein CSKR_106556 [Clonorchis sinensis]|uniref:Uncharacterized protein n=1 Tax=Clonorchis sinensis TaxID=79923 RepID=A0A8T1MQZ6_CLOSI|nr:hypothetical protein CSKR_106556 [Clonorchis sinensis]